MSNFLTIPITREGSKDAKLESNYGLRSLLMNYLEDQRVCLLSDVKKYIVGQDMSGVAWVKEKCGSPGRGVLKPANEGKPSKAPTPKISKGQQVKLDRLLKAARCRPFKTMVDVHPSKDVHHRHFPCQVSVKRCGGCCNSPPMECVPKSVKMRKFPILTLNVNSEEENKYSLPDSEEFVETVEVEEHTKCECRCRLQATDCSPHQKYDKKTCHCHCPQGKKKCSSKKVWSQDECSCVCRKHLECSTGMVYNPKKCRCEIVEDLKIDYA